MKRIAALAAAAGSALALAAGAAAQPQPGAQASATGTERTSSGATVDSQAVAASWSLGAGEYACAITATSPDGQIGGPLDPSATSWQGQLPAAGGSTITVELAWASSLTLTAESACALNRQTSSVTTGAGTYSPAAPAPPADASPSPAGSTPPSTSATAPAPASTGDASTPASDLEARISALEAEIAALTSRVDRLERAVDASQLAFEQALAAGADVAAAAEQARGTYLNAVYGLGAFAPSGPTG